MYGFRQFISDNQTDSEIISLYLNRSDIPISEIARMANKSEAEIYRILHAHDITPNRLRVNHQKVHSLASIGWGIEQIAELTGYTTRNVRYILAKNITEDANAHKQ